MSFFSQFPLILLFVIFTSAITKIADKIRFGSFFVFHFSLFLLLCLYQFALVLRPLHMLFTCFIIILLFASFASFSRHCFCMLFSLLLRFNFALDANRGLRFVLLIRFVGVCLWICLNACAVVFVANILAVFILFCLCLALLCFGVGGTMWCHRCHKSTKASRRRHYDRDSPGNKTNRYTRTSIECLTYYARSTSISPVRELLKLSAKCPGHNPDS